MQKVNSVCAVLSCPEMSSDHPLVDRKWERKRTGETWLPHQILTLAFPFSDWQTRLLRKGHENKKKYLKSWVIKKRLNEILFKKSVCIYMCFIHIFVCAYAHTYLCDFHKSNYYVKNCWFHFDLLSFTYCYKVSHLWYIKIT